MRVNWAFPGVDVERSGGSGNHGRVFRKLPVLCLPVAKELDAEEVLDARFRPELVLRLFDGSVLVWRTRRLRAGCSRMGDFGTVVGWPLLMGTIIVTSNVAGVLTGEWKGAAVRVRGYLVSGMIVILVALWILSLAQKS